MLDEFFFSLPVLIVTSQVSPLALTVLIFAWKLTMYIFLRLILA